MPSRTYTGIDLGNYQTQTVQDTELEGGSNTITFPSQGSISLSGSGSQNRVPPGPGLSANRGVKAIAEVEISGDFDFDAFPAIPDDAIITSIDFGYNASITGSGTNDSDGPGAGFQCVDISGSVQAGFTGVPSLDAADDSAVDDGNSEPVSMSASITEATTFSDNFGGTPITKAQLVASFTSIAFTALGSGECGACSSASGVYGVVDFNWALTVSNFFFTVNYDLPGVDITLDPASGDVEPRQWIRASSPSVNLGAVSVGAIVGDKVVPLNTKMDGNDLLIEVPAPPSDDCVDCLTGCPECDDCATACADNLDSEDCQACMQACLDCLEDCFENLELAEDCNESIGAPPPTSIVIICDGGTQFSGTVTLGNFTIIVANGSGIYRFVFGKTNDTVYTAERDGTTLDIKIPNPFGKSGLIRS